MVASDNDMKPLVENMYDFFAIQQWEITLFSQKNCSALEGIITTLREHFFSYNFFELTLGKLFSGKWVYL